eukprot:CAMPEP_0172309916 /NCGR_PEP_ID=MMETSP1058-20130122/10905_1 /TAXON_ID=83371 /ORGANISM="Detonula confervacea, Strain CCMP 353" /LENGTH=307 /DNA_ID=CAMNT_0013022629 /DNA_START=23 /DNA_END=946 /DNA_ORIENTATION=+
MKLAILATAFAASIGLTSAAPAIVWKSGSSSSSGPSHISDAIDARSLLSSVDGERDSSALAAVVFLVGRDANGSEGLASLVSGGSIPRVQEKYGLANEVHHHVQGVESARTVARDARQSGVGSTVAEVSMEEFQRKLSSIAQTEVEGGVEGKKVSKAEQKRRRAISEADVLVVNVGANEDATKIDSAIVAAIESSSVRNVVLSSIRSIEEVKHARTLAVGDRFTKHKAARSSAGRRLEDEADNENNQNNNNQDQEGVYYVNMTPNIFAGLLFFFLFVFTAYLGLTCMNMIEGQDVYVKKLPVIGREV